jgi:UDP-N-acetyl-D-glucosamine dehydrogenase
MEWSRSSFAPARIDNRGGGVYVRKVMNQRQQFPNGLAIIGAGYVGLPLATAFAQAGLRVVCIDADPMKVDAIQRGESYIEDVRSSVLAELVVAGTLSADTQMARVHDVDAILLCLPTPLSTHREPDLRILTSAARSLAPHLGAGQLVVLESTTFPGTTRDVLRPILEAEGLQAGVDFHLAMSPERIDPGRTDYTVRTTPKIVGGLTSGARRAPSTCTRPASRRWYRCPPARPPS